MGELAGIIAVFAVFTVATVGYQRSLGRPGARPPGGYGDAFNPINEIFHPAAHRATQELKRYDEKVEVTPSLDDGPEPAGVPLTLVRGPDGRPNAVRLRVRRLPGP